MNGCFNRGPLADTIEVQDGWITMRATDKDGKPFESRMPNMVKKPVPMTKDCQYSILTPDPACDGCKRKSGASWTPITQPGQVKAGDKLQFNIGDDKYQATAKEILAPGTDKEEIIYNLRRNYYMITSMVIANKSNHKNVRFKKGGA